MKILVVCQYYYPESFKVTDVCEALAADGHEVTVLTGRPTYPTGIVPEEYQGNKHSDEIINGVRVVRCYERGRGKGAVNLALNYAVSILRSVEYNDSVIANLFGDDVLTFQEEDYNIFNTTSSDSNYKNH